MEFQAGNSISEDFRIVAPIITGYPISIPESPMRNKPRILKLFPDVIE
ncbi:MAG TPA: hypothetical protein VFG29_05350 [Syntrophales bacterium]|nr:hypothetical protein [Syntrophales bacterium]